MSLAPFLRSAALFLVVFATAAGSRAGWQDSVSPATPGPFSPPRPQRVQYGFGWNGVIAATAELRFSRRDGQFHLEGSGGTTGLARSLWKFEGKHRSTTDGVTLRPIQTHEVESERDESAETEVTFSPEGAISRREEREDGKSKSKTRSFEFPNVMSLSSSLLYLRSQPLTDGSTYRVVVYPSTTAYLATLTVAGREKVTVPAGSYAAIKLDLQLAKIDKQRELKSHKRFKRATIWISDDADRVVLRIEAQVYVGAVYAELQSVHFGDEPLAAPR